MKNYLEIIESLSLCFFLNSASTLKLLVAAMSRSLRTLPFTSRCRLFSVNQPISLSAIRLQLRCHLMSLMSFVFIYRDVCDVTMAFRKGKPSFSIKKYVSRIVGNRNGFTREKN